ncbi:hypothetical protein ED312_19175 [Sinomicrobium pectinilyticum]|uniref:Uncharacterized protein n=1 Tax=Sinomicrobium pectinilyticum TaxID=1084421 RepID=A0A3N0DYD4_SINP1|nr:hypothetical protein ED312_19175 [Sinomicrobium pectinilyticum]
MKYKCIHQTENLVCHGYTKNDQTTHNIFVYPWPKFIETKVTAMLPIAIGSRVLTFNLIINQK